MKKADFEYVLGLLRENAGWHFNDDKYFIIDKKIDSFMREKGYGAVEDLIADLQEGNKTLIWQVVEHLAMSDTSFYRDYQVFQGLENFVLPQVRENDKGSKKIRAWSVGCSTGQEAYSVAIAIKNKIKDLREWNVNIIGTDISTESITKAQKGVYSQFEVQMGLPARYIIDNFTYDKGVWQVNADLMRMIEFRRYNLLEELAFAEKFDIILCRNVLRFFDPQVQRKVIANIHSHQKPNGYLYIGWGERIEQLLDYYEPVQGMKCLFQAKSSVTKSSNEAAVANGGMPSFVRPKGI